MTYARRLIVIVPAAERAVADQDAAKLDPDKGGARTFGVALSKSGRAPVEAWGCCTRATAKMDADYGALRAKLAGAQVIDATARGWREEECWSRALELAGLQVVQEGRADGV